MSRYIDADLVTQYFNREEWKTPDEKWWPEREIGIILDSMPTADVVEIVRCKDCENWDRHWISSTFTENSHRCAVLDNVFDGDFYCACGHRRRSF